MKSLTFSCLISKVAQKNKIARGCWNRKKLLQSPNAKSCSKLAERNRERPSNQQQIPSCTPGMFQTKMANDEKTFTFQCVPNKTFPGFESADVKERFMKW